MDELYEVANKLKEVKEQQKEFKKDNKDVFDENRRLNNLVKELKGQMREQMEKRKMKDFTHEGMEFEVKEKSRIKHDLDKLKQSLTNQNTDEALQTYVQENSVDASDVLIRQKKRKKTN
jgi:predicted transcriptional regulator